MSLKNKVFGCGAAAASFFTMPALAQQDQIMTTCQNGKPVEVNILFNSASPENKGLLKADRLRLVLDNRPLFDLYDQGVEFGTQHNIAEQAVFVPLVDSGPGMGYYTTAQTKRYKTANIDKDYFASKAAKTCEFIVNGGATQPLSSEGTLLAQKTAQQIRNRPQP